jgi:hypothetical protein
MHEPRWKPRKGEALLAEKLGAARDARKESPVEDAPGSQTNRAKVDGVGSTGVKVSAFYAARSLTLTSQIKYVNLINP